MVASWAAKYNIPIRKVQPGDMKRRTKGIGGHDDARELGSTTHWDPGPNFPWDVFLDLVKKAGSSSMDEPTIRRIVADELGKLLNAETHTSLVVGSGRKMSVVQMLRFIDLHSHETRSKTNEIHILVTKIGDLIADRLEAKEATK